ncbi:uncharacterized protein LOC104064848 isoform X2 [Cuculus canorus]|uniref:uncharacterized protein LOC104064848 isoform X2 n=1 Tax=Cuculus canorus TaxID=55661 RepID=UPI0023AA28AE|nr:uncharacterized protein LOC104064848 isoform X2 [Cuculus canorus]
MNLLAQVSSLVQTLQVPDWPFLQPWRWLGSWVGSSRQAAAGVVSTAAFFLCEELLGQHFDVVPEGVAEPQPGDLFLFPLALGGAGWWGAHAGVYCGDGEIIHLEGESQEVVMVLECPYERDRKYSHPSDLQAVQGHLHQVLWPSTARTTSCGCGVQPRCCGGRKGWMWPPCSTGSGWPWTRQWSTTPSPTTASTLPSPCWGWASSPVPRCPQHCSDGGSDVHRGQPGLEHPSPGTGGFFHGGAALCWWLWNPSHIAIHGCSQTLCQFCLLSVVFAFAFSCPEGSSFPQNHP